MYLSLVCSADWIFVGRSVPVKTYDTGDRWFVLSWQMQVKCHDAVIHDVSVCKFNSIQFDKCTSGLRCCIRCKYRRLLCNAYRSPQSHTQIPSCPTYPLPSPPGRPLASRGSDFQMPQKCVCEEQSVLPVISDRVGNGCSQHCHPPGWLTYCLMLAMSVVICPKPMIIMISNCNRRRILLFLLHVHLKFDLQRL